MPGNVASASTSVVMPLSLSRAFGHERAYAVRDNEYPNGESQRRAVTTTSRKTWSLVKRLTPTEYDALHAFFQARRGSVEPFYFYDGTETTPRWSWDASGVATVGRYLVRFENNRWFAELTVPRHTVEIRLVEVA